MVIYISWNRRALPIGLQAPRLASTEAGAGCRVWNYCRSFGPGVHMNIRDIFGEAVSRKFYTVAAHTVNFIHQIMIAMNTLAIPFVIYYQPWYLWMPIITCLVSPILGGTWCLFNQLEDHYRNQAGLPMKHYEAK